MQFSCMGKWISNASNQIKFPSKYYTKTRSADQKLYKKKRINQSKAGCSSDAMVSKS